MSKANINLIRQSYKNDIRSMINHMQSCKKSTKKSNLIDNKCYNDITKTILEKQYESKIIPKFNILSNKYKVDRYEILKSYLKNLLFTDSKFFKKEMFDVLTLVNHSESKSDVMILHSANVLREFL